MRNKIRKAKDDTDITLQKAITIVLDENITELNASTSQAIVARRALARGLG